jgi:hypothetical protein
MDVDANHQSTTTPLAFLRERIYWNHMGIICAPGRESCQTLFARTHRLGVEFAVSSGQVWDRTPSRATRGSVERGREMPGENGFKKGFGGSKGVAYMSGLHVVLATLDLSSRSDVRVAVLRFGGYVRRLLHPLSQVCRGPTLQRSRGLFFCLGAQSYHAHRLGPSLGSHGGTSRRRIRHAKVCLAHATELGSGTRGRVRTRNCKPCARAHQCARMGREGCKSSPA